MKIKQILIGGISLLALIASTGAFAEKGAGTYITPISIVVDDVTKIVSLNLDKVTITPKDISNASFSVEKLVDIATFCSSTNNNKGTVRLEITTKEGEFVLRGTGGIGVRYKLHVNEMTNQNNNITCSDIKTIKLVIPADELASAEAGTYETGLNLMFVSN